LTRIRQTEREQQRWSDNAHKRLSGERKANRSVEKRDGRLNDYQAGRMIINDISAFGPGRRQKYHPGDG